MPLPRPGKTPWPPPACEGTQKRYEELSAWFAGDPEGLATLYGAGRGQLPDLKYRTTQFRGGLVGAVSRFFWGAPPPTGELRSKLHAPAASDLATLSADLLFSEPPKIKFEDEATQERSEDITDRSGIHATLVESAEVAAALGDVWVTVAWDAEVRPCPWLRPVHADAVVPEWRSGVLASAIVWTILEQEPGGTVWRHLECHEPGRILHGLYEGTPRHLGVLHDLGDRPETARFEPEVLTGVDRLLVVHIPNLRPNRLERWSPLGRSDFSPATLGLMDALDEVWTSLVREFRLAKARAVVTEDAVRPLGPGQGATVDLDREVFVPLRINPEHVTDPVKLIQPLLRVEAHLQGTQALFEQICQSSGYTASSFGGTGSASVALTATEARQREVMSYRTRDKKALYWSAALRDLYELLLDVDRAVYGAKTAPGRPTVELGDAVVESTDTVAATLAQLAQARAASTESKVRILHPTWDDTAVGEEVSRIHAEEGIGPVPDPEVVVRAAEATA